MTYVLMTDPSGQAVVYRRALTEVARFADPAEARAFCDWRNGGERGCQDAEPAPRLQPAADSAPEVKPVPESALDMAPAHGGAHIFTPIQEPEPAAADFAPAGIGADMGIPITEQDAAPEPASGNTPGNSLCISSEPIADPALPADAPAAIDPYGAESPAFARLERGEKLMAVADDLGLVWTRLRAAWARAEKARKREEDAEALTPPVMDAALGSRRDETRAPVIPARPELKPGWVHCACGIAFNAVKSQRDNNLAALPAKCGSCRVRGCGEMS